jgi:hypothetical protein
MSDSGTYDELVGEQIMTCQDVNYALKNESHPCNKIVNWQSTELPELRGLKTFDLSIAHRPEPWAGNLAEAKILFLGSNPSFNADELFPDYSEDWHGEKLRDFAARRFEGSKERPFGASDGPTEDMQDRVYLKNGKLDMKRKVTHWNEVRGNVAAILGKDKSEVSPNHDYVMTELVHCKSKGEIGVQSALEFCTQKYLSNIFNASSAKLVFVLGVTPAKQFASLFREVPAEWGKWTINGVAHGDWPESNAELAARRLDGTWTAKDQLKHTFEMKLGFETRTVIWFPRPGMPPWPRSLNGTNCPIDPEVMDLWRSKIS